MWLADMVVLLGSSISCSSLFFIISMRDITRIVVNKEKNIIGDDAFSLFQSGLLHVICKFFGIVDMVDGVTSWGL